MRLSFLKFWILIATSIVLLRCANPMAPTGGDRDTRPPAIDSSRTTRNFQTNFQKQTIQIAFDEWVKLEDVFNQVVISPPLTEPPEITLRGKIVRLQFAENEQLKPNATYTINFGNAIKDLTEGNVAPQRFVFSTGPKIDSLRVSGIVADAFTNEPVENALFLLYDNLADSVVRTERPFYFARTDKTGQFTIANVRAGAFKGFALTDANLDYKYNQSTEKIGFPEELIVIHDTLQPVVAVKVFQEQPALKFVDDVQPEYGVIKLQFNRRPAEPVWRFDVAGQRIFTEFDKDSLVIWYDLPAPASWRIYLQKDTFLNDTITVKAHSKTEFLKTAKLDLFQQASLKRGKGKSPLPVVKQPLAPVAQNPEQPLALIFNYPLATFDTSKIHLLEDTTRMAVRANYAIDTAARRHFKVNFAWKEEKAYVLELLPGALTDWFGLQNDTIRQPVNIIARKAFGTIILKVENLRPNVNTVLQLVNSAGAVEREFQLQQAGAFQQKITALQPGEYSIRLIEDLDGNGRWDTGNYDRKRQPEKVFLQKLEQLRPNWELEVKVNAGIFERKKKESGR